MLTVAVVAFFAGALVIAGAVALAHAMPTREPEQDAAAGPLVLELEPVYPNRATGALYRVELVELGEYAGDYEVPPGAVRLRFRFVHRAGLYAGGTTTVERESEPVPAFLKAGR